MTPAPEQGGRARLIEERTVRSAMFVPANRKSWVEGAYRHGADVVVIDLEDATPPRERPQARAIVGEALPGLAERGQRVWVRVNEVGTDDVEPDLAAICRGGVEVVLLPKVHGAQDIVDLDRLLTYYEGVNGVPRDSHGIYPILETASGMLHAAEVFEASGRVAYAGGMAAPGGDIERAVGFQWSPPDFAETLFIRSHGLLAARAAGIANPVTGLVTALDESVLRAFSVQSRALGYAGTLVIHPSQVPIVNEIFSPSESEYAWSQEVIATYEAAHREGRGAFVDSTGHLVDTAHYKTAQRIAEAYERFIAEQVKA